MSIRAESLQLLAQEAEALLTRLNLVKPFALQETMVPAAAPSPVAQTAIERYLAKGRETLRQMVVQYRQWLDSPEAYRATIAVAQRRFAFLKLLFNAGLSQFDIFSDVITQRSEHETGVWLAGLDVVAADALALTGGYYHPPPVLCYIDRSHGAAIRRARTRLPGGGENPVAIIRIPRERMVGCGVASSLIHEVGHQGIALLDLVSSFGEVMREMQERDQQHQNSWRLWQRWFTEILADFWAVARVGVVSTRGLMGVVSLPRAFVFRVSLNDSHPISWIRVKLSCAMGEALYPDPQWRRLEAIWEAFYPLAGLDHPRRQLLAMLEAGIPSFVDMLESHRPASLLGATLPEALEVAERQPNRLRTHYQTWRVTPERMRRAPPSLVFAVLGQACADGTLAPASEAHLLTQLLTHWALRTTLNRAAICAAHEQVGGIAMAT
jgi:hypothetical protein